MTSDFYIRGWTESGGIRLSDDKIIEMLNHAPGLLSQCTGEFYIRWNNCSARDHFVIIPVPSPAGTIVCDGKKSASIDPKLPPVEVGRAIETAVALRRDEGIVALSGGVDSALIAALAGRECVAVGIEGSHDLRRARLVADKLGLPLECVTVREDNIEEALRQVLRVIPKKTPVDASIATTLYFVAEWAGEHGYERILAGQGADELFGGYARYLTSENLEEELKTDFRGLQIQSKRDQSVAALHNTYFSMPYMDIRVVRAAQAIPACDKVGEGIRKRPLREVAERHIPHEVAYYEKKAMQYGSGIWKAIQRLARQNGYKKSVQGYLSQLNRVE